MKDTKAIHVKPSFYTYCFEELKGIAKEYGYNLVIHGSMNRDLDLIAIPWVETVGNIDSMVEALAGYLGGRVILQTEDQQKCFPHGRESRLIEMCRRKFDVGIGAFGDDRQYYLDISIFPNIDREV